MMRHRLFSRAPSIWGVRRLVPRRVALLEPLEERLAFSVFTVSNVLDDTSNGSLRKAIMDANAAQGPDQIVFDASFYAGPRTIVINAAPPQIGGQLTIT